MIVYGLGHESLFDRGGGRGKSITIFSNAYAQRSPGGESFSTASCMSQVLRGVGLAKEQLTRRLTHEGRRDTV
jgi:hypothetical protein